MQGRLLSNDAFRRAVVCVGFSALSLLGQCSQVSYLACSSKLLEDAFRFNVSTISTELCSLDVSPLDACTVLYTT